MAMDEYDVVIIGAGASGINAAHKVQTEMPGARYIVLEARDAIGGTWDFFKYPGLRSDSYLTGFGFRWRPWSSSEEIAHGPQIKEYLEQSAAWAGIDKHIQFCHRVTGAHWSTPDSKWTIQVDVDGGKATRSFHSTFMFVCSGYYDYATPLQAEIPNLDQFDGQVVHPQFWPRDLDYANKRIVIVGSGATAITLLPVLAKTAASVAMLQRSPTYVVPLPSAPAHILLLRRVLPKWLADHVNFWKDILFQSFIRVLCFVFPLLVRRVLIRRMDRMLKGSGIPVDPHFTPRYNPWDQRLCVCPDGDFFDALKQPNTDVVTDHIEKVTKTGIQTKGGKHLDADIIVTATGLRVLILGGVDLTVDGQKLKVAEQFAWRGFMLEGLPNAAMVVGYTNMAWTLGSDACLRMMMRIIKHMQKIGAAVVTPVVQHRDTLHSEPIIGMKSTYFVMAHDRLPRKAKVDPWDERKGFISDSLLTWLCSTKTFTKGLEFGAVGHQGGTWAPWTMAKGSKRGKGD